MKLRTWEIKLGIFLLGLSLSLYLLDFLEFHGISYILDNILLQLAYLPIYIFLSTLIIDQLLAKREKRALLRKLYMVVGIFNHEMGGELLEFLSKRDANIDKIQNNLLIETSWNNKDFLEARKGVEEYRGKWQVDGEFLEQLRDLVFRKKDFLLRLMENPNLLEHEAFTELLWAIFHLTDEFAHRKDLREQAEADRVHLIRDMDRAYQLLILEWLSYMEHLHEDYPYLYSLAVRTNPFNSKARVEIQ
ncbi:hypothetical protein [Desulfitobacterium metallireducens]|uniref:Uncharacterized protein n=1 Tax=Desulfitobacterium metallireducens DSM 15288 TaxID=871968 RepID=W0EDI0_9FIRM|nr:hypothetical protein [Desulfitobacterium metallireducens]AHF07131.1 hypothetical protein DESME_08615 [Desulfitobacterium metallireducens DSM 15288]